MKKLIKAELRDLKVYYINCVSVQVFDTFQMLYLHYKRYKRIEEVEDEEFINVDNFYYNNYEELKNDRDILEDILNKKGQ